MCAHLCPLSVVLHHKYDTWVRLIQRVSVQQGFARHTQLYFGDAGSRTTEAGRRGDGLQNIIHPGSGREGSCRPAKQCDVVAPRDGEGGRVVMGRGMDLSKDVAGSQETLDFIQMS